jgi:hypothetical protein
MTKNDAFTSSKTVHPLHYIGEVREYLNTRFPGRWVGRDRQTKGDPGSQGQFSGAKTTEFKNFSSFRVKAPEFKFEFEAVGEGAWAHPGLWIHS